MENRNVQNKYFHSKNNYIKHILVEVKYSMWQYKGLPNIIKTQINAQNNDKISLS